jgi:hypothetical protein
MKRLYINSSILFLIAINHPATAAVYEFDAVITDNGYTETITCETCAPPDDFQETTGQRWDVGESIGVSFEYNVGDNSATNPNYYSLVLSDSNGIISDANSSDFTVTTNLNNSTPGSGDSDTLSVSFLQEYDSGDGIFSDTVVDIVFTDTTGTAFSDEELPEMLELADFSTISVGYDFYGENYQTPPNYSFYEEYLSAEHTPVAPIPLPPVIYLFVSGIIGLLGITRRKTALT